MYTTVYYIRLYNICMLMHVRARTYTLTRPPGRSGDCTSTSQAELSNGVWLGAIKT